MHQHQPPAPMSTPDFSAMLRWPNVPACYGWLSLDRRGQWRMRGDPVTHPGLIAFLNRQYAHDTDGRYFVQNGPQRVFVELAYTPWVLRLTSENQLQTHSGEIVDQIRGAAFDEEGNLLLEFSDRIALLCDRDLPAMLGHLRQPDGTPADEDALLDLLEQETASASTLTLHWNGQRIPVRRLRRADVARRYGFVALPGEPPAG